MSYKPQCVEDTIKYLKSDNRGLGDFYGVSYEKIGSVEQALLDNRMVGSIACFLAVTSILKTSDLPSVFEVNLLNDDCSKSFNISVKETKGEDISIEYNFLVKETSIGYEVKGFISLGEDSSIKVLDSAESVFILSYKGFEYNSSKVLYALYKARERVLDSFREKVISALDYVTTF